MFTIDDTKVSVSLQPPSNLWCFSWCFSSVSAAGETRFSYEAAARKQGFGLLADVTRSFAFEVVGDGVGGVAAEEDRAAGAALPAYAVRLGLLHPPQLGWVGSRLTLVSEHCP